jgi:hypothetical protein
MQRALGMLDGMGVSGLDGPQDTALLDNGQGDSAGHAFIFSPARH